MCQRGRRRNRAAIHFAELQAFKLLTMAGALGVVAAEASVESRARLRQLSFNFQPFHRQAELFQNSRVIAGLQFDIGEEHTVAAEAAGGAETGDGIGFRQHSGKLTGRRIIGRGELPTAGRRDVMGV